MSSPEVPPAQLLTSDFEEVRFLHDPASGLRAVLVLHDTSAGPAIGGIRCKAYERREQAVEDALRLARAMTYKSAVAEIPAGGGKVVVVDHPGMDRAAAFRALGKRIEELSGRFYTGRDLGTDARDLEEVARTTRYVTTARGVSNEKLDAATAEGVFLASGTCLEVLGIAEWGNARIAIQGLGKVGLRLAVMAARLGAEVFACDRDAEREGRAVDSVGLTLVEPDAIYEVPCEVFAPCASGGILTPETIERLRCRVVAGAANNQLASPEAGDLLHREGILYAPDFVVNSGALLVGCVDVLGDRGQGPPLAVIGKTLREIVLRSMSTDEPPHRIAVAIAEERWRKARQASVTGAGALAAAAPDSGGEV